jgi:perosamine synthetase
MRRKLILDVVEDRYAGTIGCASVFSFKPSKLLTVGEGGMIITSDDQLAERAKLIRNFGDARKFSWVALGYNFRMMDYNGSKLSVPVSTSRLYDPLFTQ